MKMRNFRENKKNFKRLQPRKAIFLVLLMFCMGLFLVDFVSASSKANFILDNQRKTDVTNYGVYTITGKSWFDVFGWWERTTKEIKLESNTEVCSNDCMAIVEIDLKEKGTLVEDVLFKRSFDGMKTWQDWNSFVNWNIKVEEDVNIFETKCVQGKEIINEKNGSSYFEQECQEVYVRTEKQYNSLDYKKKYEIGIYKVKLEGSKKGSTVLDWLIKTDGIILNEWAVWGAVIGESGVTASVTLNSPTDEELVYVNPITLNASANVTGGASLVNATLYDNSTGTWESSKLINFTNGIVSENLDEWTTFTASNSYNLAKTINLPYNTTIDRVLSTIWNSREETTYTRVYFDYIDGTSSDYVQQSQYNPPYTWAEKTHINPNKTKVVKAIRVYVAKGSTISSTIREKDTKVYGFTPINFVYTPSNTYSSGDNILWNMQFCDSDGDCGFAPSNFTFSIDSSSPQITLNYPTALIDYGKLNGTLELNLTATDTNLDKVWYNYNGTNITIAGATSGVYNQSNITLSTKKNITIYANDTAGNLASEVFSWDYLFFEEGQSFNKLAYETDTELFSINISTGLTILTSAGTLNYDGTDYRTTGSCVNGNCYFNKSLDLSLVTSGESEEKEAYWNLVLYDGSTSHNITTETQTQNVTRIHLEKCDGTYTTKTLNFTAYRESNLTQINPFRIIGTFETWLGSGSIKRTQSFQDDSTAVLNLCLTPTDRTQYTNAQLEYSFNDENITYVPRNYYFQNASLTNVTQDIRLYLLEAEDSTSFIIKVQDQKLSPVEDAVVYIQKYFLSDGTYKTVQVSKTDSNGETVGFYEVETVDYKHIIVKNGVVLLETSPQKVVGKDVPYTLTFTIGDVLETPWSYFEPDPNIQSSLTYNKTTNIVIFTYIDITGATTSGRLLVVKPSKTNSTNITICDVSSSESSATLTCNVSAYEGNIIAYGYIESEINSLLNFIISTARDIFGREGLMLGMFIIMVSALAFIWNPSAGIVAINASVIIVNLIGFISVSPIFIFGLITVSIITIILLKT